jgi:integrase
MIADVLTAYGREVAPTKKTARNIGYKIGQLLNWWGEKTVAEITAKTCRAYAASKAAQAASADLKTLRSAVKYWHQEYGPLQSMPSFWTPRANPPRERWLTRSEAARFLFHARRHQHLRRMILLQLYTGSRPGVVLNLTWDQIDFQSEIMHRVPLGAKQDEKKRAPKVRLGERILAHLRRWRRMDGPEVKHLCHYKGKAVAEPWQTWGRAARAAGLSGVTPHVLRHTRATWMMQAGVSIWDAAGFLGMSVKTLEAVYGHHAPSHQEQAANIERLVPRHRNRL